MVLHAAFSKTDIQILRREVCHAKNKDVYGSQKNMA
jgi:hypothetical protein